MGLAVDMFCTFGAHLVSHYIEPRAAVTPIKHFHLFSSSPFFLAPFFAAPTSDKFQRCIYTVY
jgi:hypothetical protein